LRILDIAVASGYAAVCLALIVVISPTAPREAAVEAAAQTRLDSAISAYLTNVGLPFLTASSSAAVCDSGSQATNATLVFNVFVVGESCGSSFAPPPAPLASSKLTLDLPGRQVVIEVWLARR
jgi:hypothetical protein